jgi:hypothetical protein
MQNETGMGLQTNLRSTSSVISPQNGWIMQDYVSIATSNINASPCNLPYINKMALPVAAL